MRDESMVELALTNAFQESQPEVGASGTLFGAECLSIPFLALPRGWQYLDEACHLFLRKDSADHLVLLCNKRTAIKDA